MEEAKAPTPYDDQELRCIYSWMLFRKPFPNSFPQEAALYEEVIVTLRDRGYTRTWDGIRHMLERVFGADATRESLDAAIAAPAQNRTARENWPKESPRTHATAAPHCWLCFHRRDHP